MKPIDGDNLYSVLDNIAAHLFETKSEPQCSMAQTIQYVMGIVMDQPAISSSPNDPLTLEQLREMDGEPVWVEYISSPGEECTGLWALISIDKEYDEIFLLNSIGGSSSYEEALADIRAIYRRKPEEGTA